MDWFRTDKEGNVTYYTDLSQFPENAHGFVYVIVNRTNGKFYVGKKILRNNLTKKLTKKEISEWSKPGRVPKKKKTVKESNWRDYWGSSQALLEDIKYFGEGSFERRILQFCFSSKQLTYAEVAWQVRCDVLCANTYNENIGGRFFRKDAMCDDETLRERCERFFFNPVPLT